MKTWVSQSPDIAIMVEDKIPSRFQQYETITLTAETNDNNMFMLEAGENNIYIDSERSANELLNLYGIKMTGYLPIYNTVTFVYEEEVSINIEKFDSLLFLKEKISYLIDIVKNILTLFNDTFTPVTGEQKTIVAEYTEPLGAIIQNNITTYSELDWQIYEYSDGSKMATLSSYTNFPLDPCVSGTTQSGSMYLTKIITIPPPSNFQNIQFVYGSRMFQGTGTHAIVNMPTGYDKANNTINYRFFRTGSSSLSGFSGGAIYVYDGGESF